MCFFSYIFAKCKVSKFVSIFNPSIRLTLHAKLELFSVRDGAGRHPVRNLLAHAVVVPPLLRLAPQVGAAMHAGNVEHSDALQRGVA